MADIADIAQVLGAAVPSAAAPSALPPPFPNGSTTQNPMALMPEPNERAKDGSTPTIHLAGKEWPIPLLAPRQNRIVVPAVAKVTKRMREIAEAKLGKFAAEEKASLVAQLGSEAALRQKIWQITDFSFEIAMELEPQFFDVICDALYWALTRAHPQTTRAQFDDMAIGMLEMIDAIGIVAQQTGMMKRSEPVTAPLAEPGSPNPSSPIGTRSSPMSATG
jgi:hypothetical protein